MPIKHAIWKVGPQPTPLGVTNLAHEQSLEEMIVANREATHEQFSSIEGDMKE